MTQSGTPGKRNWRWAVLLILVSGLLAWMLALRWRESGFDWSTFVATFSRLRLGWVAGAFVLALLTYCGRALRWQVMLRPITPRSSFLNLLKATAIGFTAVVLFGRPGEFVRPYLISVKEKVSLSSQLAAWGLERILDLLTVLLVFGLALARVDPSSVGPGLAWVLRAGGHFAGIVGSICIVVLVILRRYPDSMRRRLIEALAFLPARYLARVEPLIVNFMAGLEAAKSRTYLILMLAYTALEWVLIAGCYMCLFRAFPEIAHYGWNEVLIFMGFVSFGSIFQIPGVGGGVQVATVVVLKELFAVPLEAATSIALLTWVITFIVIIPPGLLFALQEGLSWRNLRRLGAEARP